MIALDSLTARIQQAQGHIAQLLAQGSWAEARAHCVHSFQETAAPVFWALEAQACLGLGDGDAAVRLISRAVEALPDDPNLRLFRFNLLMQTGWYGPALEEGDWLLERYPNHAGILANRALANFQTQCYYSAAHDADRAIAAGLNQPAAYVNKVAALMALGRAEAALQAVDSGLALFPEDRQLWVNRTSVLFNLGLRGEALSHAEKCAARDPEDALVKASLQEMRLACATDLLDAHLLADTVKRLGARELVASLLDEATLSQALLPYLVSQNESTAALAQAALRFLIRAMRYPEILEAASQVPEWLAQTYGWRASRVLALAATGQRAAAHAAYAAMSAEDIRELVPFYERALGTLPDDADGSGLPDRLDLDAVRIDDLMRQFERCQWSHWYENIIEIGALCQERLNSGERLPARPFHLVFLPFDQAFHAQCIQTEGDRIHKKYRETAGGWTFPDDGRSRQHDPDQRIRLGYVSGDLRNHATSHLMSRLFEYHDRQQFEVRVYALRGGDGSIYHHRAWHHADAWIDLGRLSEQDAAQRILDDQVDILVDMHGYTRLGRPGIFQYRPAPVQVAWLVYPGSTGLHDIDYIVADPWVLPPKDQSYYREQALYLPHCYQMNDDHPRVATVPIARADEGLPDEAVVYCAINQPLKYDPGTFARWMRIVRQVPGSVLWCGDGSREYRANLLQAAESHGCAGSLRFARRLGKAEHLARLALADLYLDTTYCNAHTSASDALWAGVPVLTCPGSSFQSRVAASLLATLNLPRLIASNAQEYEQRAIEIGLNRQHLAELKQRVAESRTRSPLFNARGYVAALEQAYREIVQ